MKTLILSCLCLSFFTTVPAHQPMPDEPLIVRSKLVVDGLELRLANLQQAVVKVSLTNLDKEQEVFTDYIRKHNGYTYLIEQKQLKRGRYLLTVTKGKTKRQQVILMTGNGILCSDWK